MTDDQLDRIFGEPRLEPSAAFVSNVMRAVQSEAAAPASIPFPWKIAFPGIAGWVVALVLVLTGGDPGHVSTLPGLREVLAQGLAATWMFVRQSGVSWIGGTLGLSFLLAKLASAIQARSVHTTFL